MVDSVPKEGSTVLLEGKRILVTGVLNDASIAFATARLAQEQGAEVILSSFGRVMRLTERTAKRLPTPDVQIADNDRNWLIAHGCYSLEI